MLRGFLLSALMGTPLVMAANGPCQNCQGTFCSYETTPSGGGTAEAGYGVCYANALVAGEDCKTTYGTLAKVYGSVVLTAKKIAPESCAAPAKDLTAENVMQFDTLADDTLDTVDSCSKCFTKSGKWCAYKDKDGNVSGGYCTKATTCMKLAHPPTEITATLIDTAASCPPCSACTEANKAFCAYTTTDGTPPTPLYYACVTKASGGGDSCPAPMPGLTPIFAGLKDNTKVKKVEVAADACATYDGMTADLALGDTPANTDKSTCGDCIAAADTAKWCNYNSKKSDGAAGPSGGYCGASASCSKFADFNGGKISNSPAQPTRECGGSGASSLSSSVTLLSAACAAAAAIAVAL